MHKIYIILVAGFFLNISGSFASNAIDSIGVEINQGKKVIIYKVEAKETYYSISRKYNLNPKAVMTYNDGKLLQIGVIIRLPTLISSTTKNPISNNIESTSTIEYVIKPKDNLNLLAEKYGTSVNEIKRVNGLNSINLQIGQILKIPSNEKVEVVEKPIVKPAVAQPVIKTVVNSTSTTASYVVKPKDNLNLISEQFGVSVEEIKRLNNLTSSILSIGQVLKISDTNATQTAQTIEQVVKVPVATVVTPKVKVLVEEPVVQPKVSEDSFQYVVTAGESIYSIAKKYGLTTYQIKTMNNMTANDVTVGQKLTIKGVKSVAESSNVEEDVATATSIKDPSLKYPAKKYGITKVEEKGTAVWISDEDLDSSKMLVLHRTAPIGTIVNITNPMTNRTTFAKVVGKFTENETTKDVIIVVTKAVADAIGALDKRFFCNINYGAQDNEQR